MNEVAGVVVRVDGEYAWVHTSGAGHACGACASRAGCASATASAMPVRTLKLRNIIKAQPGDEVLICATDGLVLRAAWLAYGVPLTLAIAAASIMFWLTVSDAAAVLGAVAGLGGGFFALRRRGREAAAAQPTLSMEFKRQNR